MFRFGHNPYRTCRLKGDNLHAEQVRRGSNGCLGSREAPNSNNNQAVCDACCTKPFVSEENDEVAEIFIEMPSFAIKLLKCSAQRASSLIVGLSTSNEF